MANQQSEEFLGLKFTLPEAKLGGRCFFLEDLPQTFKKNIEKFLKQAGELLIFFYRLPGPGGYTVVNSCTNECMHFEHAITLRDLLKFYLCLPSYNTKG